MNRDWFRYVAVLIAMWVFFMPLRGAATPVCDGDYAPGIILVGWHTPGIVHSMVSVVETLPEIGVSVLSVPSGQECRMIATLRNDSRVAFAELDYRADTADSIPNDPDWTQQWGPEKIGALTAWRATMGDPAIIIAVLDSGIKLGHPDLAGNVWINANEIPDNQVDDDLNGKVDDVWG